MLAPARPKLGRILAGTAALWALGAATILIKKLGYTTTLLAGEPDVFSAGRLMLVLKTYGLNLKALVWPNDLAVSYGWRQPESFLQTQVILGGIAMVLTCLALWKLRHRRSIVLGLA